MSYDPLHQCTDAWDVLCIDGTLWGPCESEYCDNPCEPYYECDCECHK
jgi:hypothetical protein